MSVQSNYVVEWSLRPAWRAAVFLLLLAAVAAWLTRVVLRVERGSFLVDTVAVPELKDAFQKDPQNSELVHRLGFVLSTDTVEMNMPEAQKYLKQAVALNPGRWDYWSDLGTTCDFAGDAGCADEAFDKALALDPMAPALQWAAGNHYLLTDRAEKSYPFFRRLLELDPSYEDATFRLLSRAVRDPQAVYANVIPQGKDASPRFAYLMFLVSLADYENGAKVWEQMINGPDRTDSLATIKPFLDFLIDHNQLDAAGTVWSDLRRVGLVPPLTQKSDNLLYNGGFEAEPVNTGFDWRMPTTQDAMYDFTDTSAHGGDKCARINFEIGRNGDYDLLDQVVLTKPATKYALTAWVKSDNLTSDSGPRLRVQEMGCQNCDARTSDPTLGTTEWHSEEIDFVTEPQTQAVRVSLWRPFDKSATGDMTGTFWVDDVSLTVVSSPEPRERSPRNP